MLLVVNISSPTVGETPGEFRWSIDQLAIINPVEIDPEEIHRQASYLSHSRTDKDVEDKRQKAIEEGQFSSSPIKNGARKYSLGSITSPSAISPPTFSPIALQVGKTPLSEQRKFTFHSPDASSGASSPGITNPSIRSPYIDGCSPIKNWSPGRLRGGPQYLSSLIRIPFTLETHSEGGEDNVPSTDVSPRGTNSAVGLPQLKCETLGCSEPLGVTAMSVTQSQSSTSEKEFALLEDVESERENETVDMFDPIDIVNESTWIKEPVNDGNLPMSDFVSGIAFSIDKSHMCMWPLAESSVLPCESSNIQFIDFSPQLYTAVLPHYHSVLILVTEPFVKTLKVS
ncbi:hypothetical protein STEG23_028467 [Scotinomys teguina]